MKNSVNLKRILSLTVATLTLALVVGLLYPNYGYSQATNSTPSTNNSTPSTNNNSTSCDKTSYPDVCIASPPPNLNCPDLASMNLTNIRVLPPDSQGLDKDHDGIGCEKK